MNKRKSGFTLVELSVVLVIIGLIIGGVLVGRDLIHASEIRATISQIEKYNTAVHTFQTKYNGLPGDLSRTVALGFGFYTSNSGVSCTGYGDGNGLLNTGGCGCLTTICAQTYLQGEPLMFWRHLNDAKLIDGGYGTGLGASANAVSISTIDDVHEFLPAAKIGINSSVEANYPGNGKNYFAIIGAASFWGNGGHNAAPNPLTAQESYAIDLKMDDGLPATGSVVAINGAIGLDNYPVWTTISAVSGCVSSGAYALNPGTTAACSLRFKFQ